MTTQVQTLRGGGTITLLTEKTALVRGTLAEVRAVLDATNRSGRLGGHGELVPVETDVYVVNVQLKPRAATVAQTAAVKPAPGLARPELATRHSGRYVAAAAVPVAGAIIWAGYEAYEEIVSHLALLIGGLTVVGVVVLIAVRAISGGGGGCEGIHVRH